MSWPLGAREPSLRETGLQGRALCRVTWQPEGFRILSTSNFYCVGNLRTYQTMAALPLPLPAGQEEGGGFYLSFPINVPKMVISESRF